MNTSYYRIIYIIHAMALLLSGNAAAQWKTFNKVVGSWDVSGNWTPAGVPGTQDSVLIMGTVIIPAGYDAMAKRVHIEDNAKMIISGEFLTTPRGRLLVEDGYDIAFLQEGELDLNGFLKIQDTNGVGILNEGAIDIGEGGKLHVDSTTSGIGIENKGAINNEGLIISEHISNYAIFNHDTIFNKSGASIEVSDMIFDYHVGIFNFNNSLLDSEGSITIKSHGQGVLNKGQIINNDSLLVQDVNRGGFQNEGIFYNLEDGFIEVSNADAASGIYTPIYSAFYNIKNFINAGSIKVAGVAHNHGFYNSGFLINADSIDISNTFRSSFFNEDTLINTENGLIMINKDQSPLGVENAEAFVNLGSVANGGVVFIEAGALVGCRNSGQLINEGSLLVENAENIGILNEGLINNLTSSLLMISNISGLGGVGLDMPESNDSLVNEGSVVVLNSDSISISNFGFIENHNEMSLLESKVGLYQGSHPGGEGVYKNEGILSISDFENVGIHILGRLKNYGEISVSIDNTAEALIITLGGVWEDYGEFSLEFD